MSFFHCMHQANYCENSFFIYIIFYIYRCDSSSVGRAGCLITRRQAVSNPRTHMYSAVVSFMKLASSVCVQCVNKSVCG